MAEEPRQEDRDTTQDGGVRNIRWGLTISLGIILAILLVAGILIFVAPATPSQRKDVVQAIGVLLAAIAGLAGLIFTAQNVRTNQRTLQTNLESTQQTLRLTKQGQITERFTRATDQLGATDAKGKKKLEVRLGGIYALEGIAKDSEEYHWPIMEVLSAYVREHAPRRPFLPPPSAQRHQEAAIEPDPDKGGFLSTPDPDIQAILTVLRRRIRHYGNGELERIDLHDTDLRRADLGGAHLEGANLKDTNLKDAELQGVKLQGANLQRAILDYSKLQGANLQEPSFNKPT